MRRISKHWPLLFGLFFFFVLAGCETTPNEGRLARVEVFRVLGARSELNANQQVEEPLEVYEQEIRESRLVKMGCVIPDPSVYDGMRHWSRLVVIPTRGAANEKDIVSIQKLNNGALASKVFGFVGVEHNLAPDAFHEYKFTGGKTVFRSLKCAFDADGVPRMVELGWRVPEFELDFSKAERARHRQFTDEDFSNSRVGEGGCALRDIFGDIYYQPSWLFKVPSGETIQKGDVVELRLGEVERGGGAGHVSQMTRKLGKREGFAADARTAVLCK